MLYVLAGVAFAWPLPAKFSTGLPGRVTGDTGVYVWNLWVFRAELLEQGRLPLSTTRIFSTDRPADLSLHNFTIVPDLLALPVLPIAGPVAAYNLVWLLTTILAAYAMFLLARDVLAQLPSGGEVASAAPPSAWTAWTGAWLAGLLFAFCPALTARSTEHLSLMNAAPLALFALAWLRALRTGRARWSLLAGAIVAWALFSDPYYGVYCVMLGAFFFAAERLAVEWRRREPTARTRRAGRVIDGLLLALALVSLWIAVTGGGELVAGGLVIRARTLYTPALILTTLAAMRLALRYRVFVRGRVEEPGLADVRLIATAGAAAAALASPLLWSVARRVVEGRYVSAPVLWRSSMPGVDLVSFVVPNPNHPWFGAVSRPFLSGLPGGFAENVASLTLAAISVVLFAGLRDKLRLPGRWVALAALFASLTAGPFLVIGTLNTGLPTPWTALRYLPIIGAARAPARFAAVVMMAVAVLFAVAVRGLLERRPGRRLAWGSLIAALLVFELWPAPREVYPAEIPSIYRTIAADPRPVLVLELPFGVRDGVSSTGDFNASAQFYQAYHGKALIGGYLSRVSPARHERFRAFPLRGALIRLSEGQSIPTVAADFSRSRAPWRRRLGYVVVDRARATPALVSFAVRALDLEKIGESGLRELYRPRAAPGQLAGLR